MDIESKSQNCHNCGTPINGRECKECGFTPGEKEFVSCKSCNNRVPKKDTKIQQYSPDGVQVRVGPICEDCR